MINDHEHLINSKTICRKTKRPLLSVSKKVENRYHRLYLYLIKAHDCRGTLNTAFFDIFTMNKAAKKMSMLL